MRGAPSCCPLRHPYFRRVRRNHARRAGVRPLRAWCCPKLFEPYSSLPAPFPFVMHLAKPMLQSFSLLTIRRGVSQTFVELAFLVPKAVTMLPPLPIVLPPLRGRWSRLGHSRYRYRNLNIGLPWGCGLSIDRRREGACEQKQGYRGKVGLHGGSYPVSTTDNGRSHPFYPCLIRPHRPSGDPITGVVAGIMVPPHIASYIDGARLRLIILAVAATSALLLCS
jgi:hypothetical protein